MDRRTFVKVAAGSPLLAAGVEARQSPGRMKAWPEVVSLDNPIAHPYPINFVEELPLALRGHAWANSFEKEAELFRFTTHEWHLDAVLLRGIRVKRVDLYDWCNQGLLDSKLNLYVDGQKVLDGASIVDFMKEGGGAFPLRSADSTKALCSIFRGWLDKDGFPDPDGFLGYFLPNKTCVVGKIENPKKSSIAVEVEFDMARYSTKKQGHQRSDW